MVVNLFSKMIPSYKFDKLINIDADIFLNKDLIIFDIDNTLVFSETSITKEEIISWFAKINKKYKCVCFSNSRTIKQRKNKIYKMLKCEIFLSKFKKPSKKLFNSIKKHYDIKTNKIIVIGDRIFPDVLFGNLNEASTILLNPISKKENILVSIIRKIEKLILFLINFLMYNTKKK